MIIMQLQWELTTFEELKVIYEMTAKINDILKEVF